MGWKSTIMFVVLACCGTTCILVSLAVIAGLYHSHAILFESPHNNGFPAELKFAFLVVLPALLVMLVGFKLIKTGVDIGVKGD